jgi:CTP synthase
MTYNSIVDWPIIENYWSQDKYSEPERLQSILTSQHVSSIKVDPYLNVDAGTMNPKEYDSLCPILYQ